MESPIKMPTQTSLFQVYLRLRPPSENLLRKPQSEQWLVVERPLESTTDSQGFQTPASSTHITLQPPSDSRKRAIERFGFTKVFREDSSQLDIFEETGTVHTLKNLLQEGRDGLVATLGVTGSGKVIILGLCSLVIDTDVSLEPHNSWISEPKGHNANDPRCAIPLRWPEYSSCRSSRLTNRQ